MGAWAYCRAADCEQGLRPSTVREIVSGSHFCPACGFRNEPNRTLEEAVEELEERLEALERMAHTHGAGP